MKNKAYICFELSILILAFLFLVTPYISYAHEADEQPSAARSLIEATEEKTLGTEKHAQLESVEPGLDTAIYKSLPIAVGTVSLGLLAVAWYLKTKKSINDAGNQ